jgi:hypothetical protein
MVTQFSTTSTAASAEAGIEASDDLIAQINEFLAKGRWSPDMVRVQLLRTPLATGTHLVQALVTHPAPSN